MTRRHNAIHTMAIIYQKVVASMQIVFNYVINDTMNKFTYNLDIFLVDIRIMVDIYSKIIYGYTFFVLQSLFKVVTTNSQYRLLILISCVTCLFLMSTSLITKLAMPIKTEIIFMFYIT